MKLREVDKKIYRSHLNLVIAICIATLAAGSLGIAQGLIALFPSGSESHFHWNLTGVIASSIIIATALVKYKKHPFMLEVAYVWDLKQALNKVTRKMRKVKQAVERGDAVAMQALNFFYAGSRQLWTLDDNNITLEELALWQGELNSKAAEYKITLDLGRYESETLKAIT